jgi:DNA-binding protein Fis
VIVISDFLDEVEDIRNSLSLLRHAGHEVIAFQVLDPTELTLELKSSDATIVDVETGAEIRTQPYQMQQSYQRAVQEYLATLKQSLLNEGIDYVLLETTTPFDHALLEYLHKRQRMS